MSNRWKMNRLGFVNFWLYDEETFSLEDGKLLLRGQNGSGKSITTQSFIPFILDGDRTPSRLDPFGSSDRRMEYYFLGEEERDEATGYLFLELKKEETEQYRTICIGQRAKRGAAMGFWGFVLTDGRRIGYDLQLYKEVGSTKVPYSKQDLKKILGSEVPFTDQPGEYKELVNKYVFGFPRMEQYEQLIRLLVKVRAPKLSKEFKPTKVYDILNESLQTLTDEDLRAMVDAMEKMDSIQNNLDHLREAYGEVRSIQKEYTRYNQFMLGQKAKAYLDEKRLVEIGQRKLDASAQMLEELKQEQQQKEKDQAENRQRQNAIAVELAALRETDLDSAVQKLEDDRKKERDVRGKEEAWRAEADQMQASLLESDRRLREYEAMADSFRENLEECREELQEYQEVLLFSGHEEGCRRLKNEKTKGLGEIEAELKELLGRIRSGSQALREQEEIGKRYDEAAAALSDCQTAVSKREEELGRLSREEDNARDAWIEQFYQLPRQNQELIPQKEELALLEKMITEYQGARERAAIRKLLEELRESRRRELKDLQDQIEKELREIRKLRVEKLEELSVLQEKRDWEPKRRDSVIASRKALEAAGIECVPFYQAVEFSDRVEKEERDLLETQLRDLGILDALVVERKNWNRIQSEFPEFTDVMITVSGTAKGEPFEKLTASGELSDGLKQETEQILRNISEKMRADGAVVLDRNGFFQNGVLLGKSLPEEASFIGQLERRRRLEQEITLLKEEIWELEQKMAEDREEQTRLIECLSLLDQEYERVPDSAALDLVLEKKRECLWCLERETTELQKAEKAEREVLDEKNRCIQKVIRLCRTLPYARTLDAYQEAEEAAQDYQEALKQAVSELRSLGQQQQLIASEREKQEQMEDHLDRAIRERDQRRRERELLLLSIQKTEEFLNSPENRQIAQRLKALKEETDTLLQALELLGNRLAVIRSDRERIAEELSEEKQALAERIARETRLREYFEEELSLKLVLEQGSMSISECAAAAFKEIRETDRTRNAAELTTSLYRCFQQHNSSLVRYGTALEDCFEEAEDAGILRKRQRITSTWNGKKLYFVAFCQMLKNSIEETELLIQQKDRELFEDILSRTLSQQLTDRIAESREWIRQMSNLMKGMDTSMGLSFSLEWKPKSADSDQEIDTMELEKLLMRDRNLLTREDVERVARHFRSKIRVEKQKVEENGGAVNYMDLVRDALDYRKWFAFQMYYYRNQEAKKPLTNSAFNKFSGGEKAMAMYVPLFAAVSAQYQKCSKEDSPRMMALDEAFAGVDEKNISSMFQLVKVLDFDYIMNSQAIWGCYETVPALRISELHRPADAKVVTVIHYTWNGHERILDEQ